MRTITCAASKGGAGKSALIIGIASLLHSKGKKTLILDMDEQASLANWLSDDFADIPRVDPNLMKVEALLPTGGEAERITQIVERLVEIEKTGEVDYLLIDTKGEQAKLTAAIGAYSDYVLCPTNGNAIEFEPVVKTYLGLKAMIDELRSDEKIEDFFKVVLTRRKTVEAADIRASQATLAENFNAVLGPMESSSYNKAIQIGTSIDCLLVASKSVLEHTDKSDLRTAARREVERHTKALHIIETMMNQILGDRDL